MTNILTRVHALFVTATMTQMVMMVTTVTVVLCQPCVPGTQIGSMLIRSPNMSSIVMVGSNVNVTWDYSTLVTNPPAYVDMYTQLVAPGTPPKWVQQLSNRSVSPRWIIWTPSGLIDGKYKIMLVPDGKMTDGVAANKLPCFSNGQVVPSSSAEFSISNSNGGLVVYPDNFAPSSVGMVKSSILGIYLLILACLLLL